MTDSDSARLKNVETDVANVKSDVAVVKSDVAAVKADTNVILTLMDGDRFKNPGVVERLKKVEEATEKNKLTAASIGGGGAVLVVIVEKVFEHLFKV